MNFFFFRGDEKIFKLEIKNIYRGDEKIFKLEIENI